MVDACSEVDLRRLEGVVGREVYREKEDTSRIWAITLQLSISSGPTRILTTSAGGQIFFLRSRTIGLDVRVP